MIIYKLFKKPFFARFQTAWQWPTGYSETTTWEEVTFASRSRALLAGLLGAARGDRVRGNIVCAHPMGLSAKGYFLKNGIADFLRDEGYNVLLFDFNGFGDSTDGDYNLPADTLAAGKYLRSREPGYRTGIFGISFGGAMAVCALPHEESPYDAAVFESTFTSLVEFWAHFGMLGKLIKLMPLLTPGIEKKMNALHNAEKIHRAEKILWIHGDADKQTPVTMGERLQEAAPVPGDLWVVPGGKHARCFPVAPEEYREKLFSFFNETLDKVPVPGS